MGMIFDNLQQVRREIENTCQEFSRPPAQLKLLAVSKTFPTAAIEEAYAAGQRLFGENYIQEGVQKIESLRHLRDIEWHMIGPVQSNKTRLVATHFHWVHSIDRLKTAQRLAEQRTADLPPLQVCLQVNIDGSANKAGCAPQEALGLAQDIATLSPLRLRGIMVMPDPAPHFNASCAVFAQAHELFQRIKAHRPEIDTLSMGMSADLRAAIKEGSTLLRVGSAIFGARA